MDFEEKEPLENEDEEPLNGKGQCDDWFSGQSLCSLQKNTCSQAFLYDQEMILLIPFIEITSPPPELPVSS